MYRLEQEFNRQGLKLSRQTMANWLLKASEKWMQPVYDALHKQLCKEPVLYADETTIKMVTESVDAFVNKDTALADTVIKHDDIVDEYFLKVKSSLIKLIAEKPDDGEYALDLLMIAKYFERIGDHAVNIAEWVEFSVTGVHKGESEI